MFSELMIKKNLSKKYAEKLLEMKRRKFLGIHPSDINSCNRVNPIKHKLISKIIVIWILFLGDIFYGQISLDSCQQMAISNYPLIRQFGLIDQTSEFTLSNANKAFLPQLSVNVIGGVIYGLPSSNLPESQNNSSAEAQLISVIQINQAIWDGGVTKASKELIMANAEIEKADIQVSLYQIRERVNNLFFGILLIEEQMNQTEIHLSNLIRNSKRIQSAVENGTAYMSD